MWVCVCVWVYVWEWVRVCLCSCVYVLVRVRVCACMSVFKCIYVSAYARIRTCNRDYTCMRCVAWKYECMCVFFLVYFCTRFYERACIFAYKRVYVFVVSLSAGAHAFVYESVCVRLWTNVCKCTCAIYVRASMLLCKHSHIYAHDCVYLHIYV